MVSCLPPQDQAGASGSSVISTTLVEARELLLLSVGVGSGVQRQSAQTFLPFCPCSVSVHVTPETLVLEGKAPLSSTTGHLLIQLSHSDGHPTSVLSRSDCQVLPDYFI